MAEFQQVTTGPQIAEVARLAREIWNQHYAPVIGQGQVDYMLERFQSVSAITDQLAEGYEYYLVSSGQAVAGYLAVVPRPGEGACQLSKLYLRQAVRGQGLGREMIAFAEHRARAVGAGQLWLTVNRHNAGPIAFYEAMGFQNVGPTVADIGGGYVMDDFKMVKQLKAEACES